jgi:hypothetical protein
MQHKIHTSLGHPTNQLAKSVVARGESYERLVHYNHFLGNFCGWLCRFWIP